MSRTRWRVGLLGAGNIAGPYAISIAARSELTLVGVFDLDPGRSEAFAAEHDCTAFSSLEDMCSADLDCVVNLTSAPLHFATTKQLLELGQNVYSEKPLASTRQAASELIDVARQNKLALACSPSLWLGHATLRVAESVLSGAIGRVGLVTAEVNQGRIETWHPDPEAFYRVGPVVDAGVYPLAYLTAIFGPLASVTAESVRLLSPRKTLAGDAYELDNDDGWIVVAKFTSGTLLRLTCNFYVESATEPRRIDFHGETGSLRLDDWLDPGSSISIAEYGKPFGVLHGPENRSIDWSLGVIDVMTAHSAGISPRVSGAHAAHISEILQAVSESAETGRRVSVTSSFPSPFR